MTDTIGTDDESTIADNIQFAKRDSHRRTGFSLGDRTPTHSKRSEV